MAISNKRRAFIEEYLKDFNATRAAIAAGYSEKTAYSIGNTLLKHEEVREAIKERIESVAMTADEVLLRLAGQARGSIEDFIDIDESGSGVFRLNLYKAQEKGVLHLIKSLTPTAHGYKIELYDAHAALVDIGRHLAMFTDKHEIAGANGGPLVLVWPEDSD